VPLHCKLFDRNPNGFMLTDAGQKLFDYAEIHGKSRLFAISENVGGHRNRAGRPGADRDHGRDRQLFIWPPRLPKLRESFPRRFASKLVTERHLINLTKA